MLRRSEISSFESELLAEGIKDQGVHHEFTTGVHGEKLDFEVVERGTALWQRWVGLKSAIIRQIYPGPRPPFLLSIANGTCDLTDDIASELTRNGNYEGLVVAGHTEKIMLDQGRKLVRLRVDTHGLLVHFQPDSLVEIDDAATTGSTTAMPVDSLRAHGIEDIRVLYTWLRRPELPYLITAKVPHYGIIENHPLPDFTEEECVVSGFCADGIPLVPYGLQAVPSSPRAITRDGGI